MRPLTKRLVRVVAVPVVLPFLLLEDVAVCVHGGDSFTGRVLAHVAERMVTAGGHFG